MVALENTKMVAIVDDDDLMRSALEGLLKAVGLPAQAFASAEEFLKSGQQRQARCLITDIRMPGMSGLELQAHLNAERCRIPIIFITAHGDEKNANASVARRRGRVHGKTVRRRGIARECAGGSGKLGRKQK